MSNDKEIWSKFSSPPPSALKRIEAGRLKGKSDINPQWRYEAMTEVFGPCGIGWKFTIDRLWTEPASEGQVFAFALVSLYINEMGVWSDPIPGCGGSMLLEMERNGMHSSDEGYKMAITDALGTAMKMIGVAAEVYRGTYDGSKYQRPVSSPPVATSPPTLTEEQQKYFPRIKKALDHIYGADVAAKKSKIKELTAFTGKDGTPVEGVEDYRKLNGKRLQIFAHRIEEIALETPGAATGGGE